MRIPLDYYRVLGLPIQATAEQLQQAHRDRSLQVPRREYSELAIAERKRLIDEAFQVLSDPEQRQTYDASFLSKTYDDLDPNPPLNPESSSSANPSELPADAGMPSIELQDHQLIGGLIILLELGEYELVLKLGRSYFTSNSLTFKTAEDPNPVLADIVLTIGLACLELGREQWQQGQYESAAESLEVGQDLLLREGLFINVRSEIQADLYKLRPYRILELLALPETHTVERRQGLQLLRDMLQERSGIDGTGNDQSGLSIDDFLRFIQQLRSYLTVAEQQNLFELEARRPSAVATYLAVYALIARGFAERQPALVRRARLMLTRLGTRQDVYLEQAVTALLLGQTEEASRALDLSQEHEPLAFIREHSQGAPDLLPGLCLYSERWLQDEVFPHFRDLSQQQVSLKHYFADEQVQAYLEELPHEAEESSSWTATTASSKTVRGNFGRNSPSLATPPRPPVPSMGETWVEASPPINITAETEVTPLVTPSAPDNAGDNEPGIKTVETVPIDRRIFETKRSPESAVNGNTSRPPGTRTSRRPKVQEAARITQRPPEIEDLIRRPSHRGARPNLPRLFLVIALGLGSLGLLGVLGLAAVRKLTPLFQSSVPDLLADQPMVELSQPPIAIPSPSPTIDLTTGPLTQDGAKQVLQTWLTVKAAALGPDHAIDKLSTILVSPVLEQWQKRAEDIKQQNTYRQYKHELSIDSVEMDPSDPDQAKVNATITEATDFFEAGEASGSQNDSLRVRYDLVRQNKTWLIQNWAVLR